MSSSAQSVHDTAAIKSACGDFRFGPNFWLDSPQDLKERFIALKEGDTWVKALVLNFRESDCKHQVCMEAL